MRGFGLDVSERLDSRPQAGGTGRDRCARGERTLEGLGTGRGKNGARRTQYGTAAAECPGPGRAAHFSGSGVQLVTDGESDPFQGYLRVNRFERAVEFEEPGAHEVAKLAVGVELVAGGLREVAEAEPVDEGKINFQDRPDDPAGERLCPR